MENQKWFNTMSVYDEYEKRFAQASLNKKFYLPESPKDKESN